MLRLSVPARMSDPHSSTCAVPLSHESENGATAITGSFDGGGDASGGGGGDTLLGGAVATTTRNLRVGGGVFVSRLSTSTKSGRPVKMATTVRI